MSEKGDFCLLSFRRAALDGEDVAALISSLHFGERETERLSKIKNSNSLASSLCALLCLQELVLSLGLGERDLTIIRDENGKPRFESLPLCFSISHSGDLCTVALSSKNVGIDLEFINASRNTSAIAKRFFSAEERLSIECSDSPSDAFFSAWTRKEALAKLSGAGLVSICAGSLKAEKNSFSEYAIELDGKRAALSVCRSQDSKDNAADIEIRNTVGEELRIRKI